MTRHREKILDLARALISHDRADAYGDAGENFHTIAAMWTSYLLRKKDDVLAEHDVAVLMILLKIARLAHDPKHWDSWVDIIGYAALGAEVANDAQ